MTNKLVDTDFKTFHIWLCSLRIERKKNGIVKIFSVANGKKKTSKFISKQFEPVDVLDFFEFIKEKNKEVLFMDEKRAA